MSRQRSRGFVWFQGFNDTFSDTFAEAYEQNITDFINDLRTDLGMPDLPVVIGQTHKSDARGLVVREAQEAVGNTLTHATSVYTQDLSNYFHFDGASYLVIGNRFGNAMKGLLDLDEVSESVPSAPSGLTTATPPVLQAELSWSDNSNNEDVFFIERSTHLDSAFQTIAALPANTTTYTDWDLTHGTTYYYRIKALNEAGYSSNSEVATASTSAMTGSMPPGWSSMDIGNTLAEGSTTYGQGKFEVKGHGLHFAFVPMDGDGEIVAKLDRLIETANWNNAGLMIRDSLDPGSKYTMTLVNHSYKIIQQHKKEGSSKRTFIKDTTLPVWLKLVRKGDYFTAYSSADGTTWEETARDTIAMGNTAYWGMASYSNHRGASKTTRGFWSRVKVESKTPLQAPSGLVAQPVSSQEIELSWVDNAENETGFVIEQALSGSDVFEEIARVAVNTTTLTIGNLSPGTTYLYKVKAYNSAGESSYTDTASATTHEPQSGLPEGWSSMDIGNPNRKGSTKYKEGVFHVTGQGRMSQTHDHFHFAFVPMNGDGEIVAKLDRMFETAHWNNVGLMVRDSLTPGAQYIMTVFNHNSKIFQQYRKQGTYAKTFVKETRIPVWLKLVRTGDYFIAYSSADSITWEETSRDTIPMGNTTYMGLASYSNHPNKSTVGNWSHVRTEQKTFLLPPSDLAAQSASSKEIELSWMDNTENEAGFVIEQSIDSIGAFEEVVRLGANTTSMTMSSLSPGATYFYRVKAYDAARESSYTNVAAATTDTLAAGLPAGWSSMDIGNTLAEGSTTYDKGKFEVKGHGLHFAFVPMDGDGEIVAKLDRLIETANWNNAGLMIRDSLDPGSKYTMTLVNHSYKIIQQHKKEGSSKRTFIKDTTLPVWLKLVRKGDYFTAYSSADGAIWEETARDTIAMGNTAYWGMASYSNHRGASKTTRGFWSHVKVTLAPETLAAPSSLSISTSTTNAVNLQWVDNAQGESKFIIERSFDSKEDSDFKEVAVLPANSTNYTDLALTPGIYYYRVRAANTNGSSYYTNIEQTEVLEFKNTVLYLHRLAGDYDKSHSLNEINVSTDATFSTGKYMYTNMNGKVIDVKLEQPVSSEGSSISLKVVPNNLSETMDIFRSGDLSIRQAGDQLVLNINGSEWTGAALLDTITCNHIIVRLSGETVEFGVNGEWVSEVNNHPVQIGNFTVGSYNGQLWDIRLYNRLLSTTEVGQISARCGSGVDTDGPNPDRPQYSCGSYYCLWAKEDVDLRGSRYLYFLGLIEQVYQRYVMEAGMYDHKKGLEKTLFKMKNFIVDDKNSWISWSYEDPMTKDDHRASYNWHENFHSYQSKDPNAPYNGGKWLNESSANWGTSYVVDYYPNRSSSGITLYPHWPIAHHNRTYNVPGGNRDYHGYIFLSYITRFVTGPSFIGKLYNIPGGMSGGTDVVNSMMEILHHEGHDFAEVFKDFAARTTVWDYEDGSGPDWEESENAVIEIFDERGHTDYNHKFVNIMLAEGTNGVMTEVPAELRPGSYGWNAIKIDSTGSAQYIIKFTGKSSNPEDTEFRPVVIKESGGAFEYFDMPVNDAVAFGSGQAQFAIHMEAGEKLYLVVASTPASYYNGIERKYDYRYSFEVVQNNDVANARIANTKLSERVQAETTDWKVYPIPTDGHLEIQMPSENNEVLSVELIDLAGKSIPSAFSQENGKMMVDFHGPAGVYYMHTLTPGGVVTFKIVKQ